MIQLNRNYTLPEREDDIIPIKVIGVGGAGSNALDRVVLDGMDKSDLVAANTDVQSLASSVAAAKVQLGRSVTRGLGTGGDPELGYHAARESMDEIREALTDARLIFICTGLGGGTGSGAAPVVAEVAREMGALVVALATVPFTFEGKRRAAQAQEALAHLQRLADAVVCFENDRMGDIVAPKAGIHQAFAAADMTISQSVRSIINVLQRPGLIRIGFDDLLSALRGRGGRCLFGFGESDSDNRAHDALTQALKNPLMDRGRMLEETSRVLVHIAGGPGMTLSEVEILMRDLNKHVGDQTQLLFGTGVDGRMGNRLSVTIISSLGSEVEPLQVFRPAPEQVAPVDPSPSWRDELIPNPEPIAMELPPLEPATLVAPIPEEPPVTLPSTPPEEVLAMEATPSIQHLRASEPVPQMMEEEETEAEPLQSVQPVPVEPPPAPRARIIPPRKKPAFAATAPLAPENKPPPPGKAKPEKPQSKQEILQFEPVTRGRFEKSEPTIVEGQDLDVPTFLRKNVRVK